MDYDYYYGQFDENDYGGNEFYTDNGVKCYYYFSRTTEDGAEHYYSIGDSDDRFHFRCYTENGFWFDAIGYPDQFDWIIEIIKSLSAV